MLYATLGWRLADVVHRRGLPGRSAHASGLAVSIIFGTGVTVATPGSAQGLHLIVSDIEAAHDELVAHGVTASEVFHDAGGVFHHAGTTGRVSGPDPERHSYGSFVSFEDPDGNGWVLQEITTRLPGRIDPAATSFASASDLSKALQRASAAHGEHEARIGREDPDWPDWYADYMVREQAGEESDMSSDYDVIVIGGGAPGEHCAAALATAASESPSSSATWSVVCAPTGRAFRRSRCCARVKRCRARVTRAPELRSTSRARLIGATSWSRITPIPGLRSGCRIEGSRCCAGAVVSLGREPSRSTASATPPSTSFLPMAPIRSSPRFPACQGSTASGARTRRPG